MDSRIVALAVLGALPAAASAQDFMSNQLIPPTQETFVLSLGGITNTFDTNLRIDGDNRNGTPINLEDNGMKDSLSSLEVKAMWRFAPRHRLSALYYGADRSGTRTYSTSIDIGDASYPLGATVSASNKTEVVSIDYRYSFIQDPSFELAGIFGIYGGTVKYDVNAVGVVSNQTVTYQKSASTRVPIPVFGLSADWYLTPAWRLGASIAGMKAKIGSVDGQAMVAGAHVDYQIWRGLGVGLGWAYVDLEADAQGGKFNGNFEYKTNSVSAYARFVF
jgi:hypothetical protein